MGACMRGMSRLLASHNVVTTGHAIAACGAQAFLETAGFVRASGDRSNY
jgi:hypothetical protein